MWEPDRRVMDRMLIYLHESPLFPCGITSEQLTFTLCSLEMLFLCEADNAGDSVLGSPFPEQSQMIQYETEERDTQMGQYDYFGIHDAGSTLWRGSVRQSNYTEVEVGIGYTEERPVLVKVRYYWMQPEFLRVHFSGHVQNQMALSIETICRY
jgi:hypothetical protein